VGAVKFDAPSPHPPVFHQVLILKEVEVVYFDTRSEVLILKRFLLRQNCASVMPFCNGDGCDAKIKNLTTDATDI